MKTTFLEKRLTVKIFLYVFLSLILLGTVGYFIMDWNTSKIEKEFADYKTKTGKDKEFYVYVVDSLDKKYEMLYNNLDNLYDMNWESIDFWIDYYDVKNKEIAISQIKIETGNLKSNICVNYGNLVGMHFPRIRKTTASGWVVADNNSKVAVYKYWWKSIEDYKLWQEYFGYDEEVHNDEYLTLLDNHGTNGYATAKNYIHTVRKTLKEKYSEEDDGL